jgi:hypothetical protein
MSDSNGAESKGTGRGVLLPGTHPAGNTPAAPAAGEDMATFPDWDLLPPSPILNPRKIRK